MFRFHVPSVNEAERVISVGGDNDNDDDVDEEEEYDEYESEYYEEEPNQDDFLDENAKVDDNDDGDANEEEYEVPVWEENLMSGDEEEICQQVKSLPSASTKKASANSGKKKSGQDEEKTAEFELYKEFLQFRKQQQQQHQQQHQPEQTQENSASSQPSGEAKKKKIYNNSIASSAIVGGDKLNSLPAVTTKRFGSKEISRLRRRAQSLTKFAKTYNEKLKLFFDEFSN